VPLVPVWAMEAVLMRAAAASAGIANLMFIDRTPFEDWSEQSQIVRSTGHVTGRAEPGSRLPDTFFDSPERSNSLRLRSKVEVEDPVLTSV
jgi:hypothetical protein